jgi:hypothetical protein
MPPDSASSLYTTLAEQKIAQQSDRYILEIMGFFDMRVKH